MSKKGWVKLWLLIVFIIFIVLVISIFYFTKNGRPLRFTNYLSYDTKLNFIRNTKALEKADTLIIGSSMGLNNIDSETLEKSKKFKYVLNASAWAMNTNEVFELLKAIDLTNIKTVIYPHQYFDLEHYGSRNINKDEVFKFLKGNFIFSAYLNTFKTLNNNLKTYIFWEKNALNKNDYSYLGFDKNGDINLDFDKKYINQKRWVKHSINPKFDDRTISSLIQMNDYLKNKGIKFIAITTPHRIEVLNKNIKLKDFFYNYVKKMQILSRKHNFIYINSHEILMLNDDNFVDSSHLNLKGGIEVSNVLLNRLE